ncbi:DUF72 domain-containing protein [Bordetella avium]|uniref:DUF72 domain-containing protein n=1 Tax=Bordetella avium TaxID=521 RepID=UPI000E0C0725|nr:DUF72 domain-containing protein [Bordetella avium]RIQ13139.1 DUF72 domain-containing protein [Bordetella avium]RIQ37705.1 DUF72 domain-containing protein [Bordetella avium]RIQ42171.1 DUF72 domain-containing protein [Bordetella avium]RIQ42617.1 DUF72 domain-containing protein [Bordetella avium]RIQ49080.1 DUF72 domain-containing protein [Bordetella avium]
MAILTGTASWTDPTLLACGRFYPPEARDAASRLRFYASRFPLVEADSPYYGLAAPATTQAWAARTPEGFLFNIKVFRLFTGHQTPLRTLPADLLDELGWDRRDPRPCFDHQIPADWRDELWRRYLLALESLRAVGKLGLVHCQFPPWVGNDARGAARLDDCARRLAEMDASIEFRHASWWLGRAGTATLDRLRERALVHTVVDAPANSVPAVWANTRDDIALVRLHGRNAQTWNRGGPASSSRFQYEYNEAELAELARRIQQLQTRQTHVILNTNYQDQGMKNARNLRHALQTGVKRGAPPP